MLRLKIFLLVLIKSIPTSAGLFQKTCLSLMLMLYYSASIAGQTQSVPKFVTDFLQNNAVTLGKQYYTSFEEYSEFAKFYIVPPNYLNTSTHLLQQQVVYDQSSAHEAYTYGPNPVSSTSNTNHKAYPSFQLANTPQGVFSGAVLVEIEVLADFQLTYQSANSGWSSIATFTSYSDNNWYRGYLINIEADQMIHLMHVPMNGQEIHDIYQTSSVIFPMGQWVRITAYIDYTSNNTYNSPYIAVWQDGVLVSAARFNPRLDPAYIFQQAQLPACMNGIPKTASIAQIEKACGLIYTGGLSQTHFGLYTPPLLGSGTMYNDDLSISEIVFPQN